MKKLVTLLFLILGLGAVAQQGQIQISGNVFNEIPEGVPVPGHLVFIEIFENNTNQNQISATTVTNEAGYYFYETDLSFDEGFALIYTASCGDTISFVHPFGINSSLIQQDFIICENNNSDCQAMFSYVLLEGFAVDFINNSIGEELVHFWDFGDGTTSSELNPQHTYAQQGVYDVCLYIQTPDSSCFDVMCMPVQVGGDVPPECMAMFEYAQTGDLAVAFVNLSMGINFASEWDFGDGQSSDEFNPVHVYESAGAYDVTLTITDSTLECVSSVTETIVVGQNSNCQAMFTFELLEGYAVNFYDSSIGENLSYFWDFGDGNTANTANPQHTYNQQGVYDVCLYIQTPDSSCFDVMCMPVQVGGDVPPECQASFAFIQSEGFGVEFVNTSVSTFGELEPQYFWNFGDGASSTEESPYHIFDGPGIYDVCLTMEVTMAGDTNTVVCSSAYCEPVLVMQDTMNCIAQFAYYPDSSNTPNSLQFVDMSYGGGIDTWFWDFGDGETSDLQNPVHTFSEPGVYQVCLHISGPDCQSGWCEEVYIGSNLPCFNYFTYESAANDLLFIGYHSSDAPANYLWEFGDGTTGQGQQVVHSYEAPGVYFVSLFTNDDNQCDAISSQMIVVGDTIAYQQIYGQVFQDNLPAMDAMVLIFSLDTTGNYFPYFDIVTTDSDGVYVFPYVPQGEFYVLAMGMDVENFLPTYYGDVIHWEDASVISLGQPDNPYNINLVSTEANMFSGNNAINGQISNAVFRAGFVDLIEVYLYNSDQQALGYSNVQDDGSFSFTNLPSGMYYVYPELAGVAADMIQVDLNGENTTVQVNMTFNENGITNIQEPVAAMFETSALYPNPVTDFVNVLINAPQKLRLSLQVFAVDGRVMLTDAFEAIGNGHELKINLTELPKGFYILRLSDEQGKYIQHKFIK